ncbi:hypothetical protein TCSYLVIO_005273 [Trypanosoma cruzi]|nr:hypothetical protein TCSYLVIO_005273 [Trypanosoma cruzi]
MKDAPPPIHGNNSVAAACPFPLLLLLAAAAAVPILSSGARETGLYQLACSYQYLYALLVRILCTRDMLYALSLFCRSLMWRHHACIMGWDNHLFDFF